MRMWIGLVNNLHYYEAKLNLWLIYIGLVWPHSTEALTEVRASDHLIYCYDEWLWERDHPEDRLHFDWSDPDAGYDIQWSRE
jgi:hypothetical protein